MEKTGDAITFVTAEDTPMVRDLERVMGVRLEKRRLAGFNYDAPAPERPRIIPMERARRRPGRQSFTMATV
jgi:superfamily II DNA/RNA helicase